MSASPSPSPSPTFGPHILIFIHLLFSIVLSIPRFLSFHSHSPFHPSLSVASIEARATCNCFLLEKIHKIDMLISLFFCPSKN